MQTHYTKKHWSGCNFEKPNDLEELKNAFTVIESRLYQIHAIAEMMYRELVDGDGTIHFGTAEVVSELAYELSYWISSNIDINKCYQNQVMKDYPQLKEERESIEKLAESIVQDLKESNNNRKLILLKKENESPKS